MKPFQLFRGKELLYENEVSTGRRGKPVRWRKLRLESIFDGLVPKTNSVQKAGRLPSVPLAGHFSLEAKVPTTG